MLNLNRLQTRPWMPTSWQSPNDSPRSFPVRNQMSFSNSRRWTTPYSRGKDLCCPSHNDAWRILQHGSRSSRHCRSLQAWSSEAYIPCGSCTEEATPQCTTAQVNHHLQHLQDSICNNDIRDFSLVPAMYIHFKPKSKEPNQHSAKLRPATKDKHEWNTKQQHPSATSQVISWICLIFSINLGALKKRHDRSSWFLHFRTSSVGQKVVSHSMVRFSPCWSAIRKRKSSLSSATWWKSMIRNYHWKYGSFRYSVGIHHRHCRGTTFAEAVANHYMSLFNPDIDSPDWQSVMKHVESRTLIVITATTNSKMFAKMSNEPHELTIICQRARGWGWQDRPSGQG